MNVKRIETLLNKHNKKAQFPVSVDDFVMNAKRYLKATKEQRVICSIDKVSASGMSRTMKFLEMPKNGGYLLSFYNLFDILGHEKVSNSDYFRIHGCGMDMVFNTNYNIMQELNYLGLITFKTCRKLQQQTPQLV